MAQEQLDGNSSVTSATMDLWTAFLGAILGRSGIERMQRDAELGLEELSPPSADIAAAVVLLALAKLLAKRTDGANALGAAVDHARTAARRLNGWPGSLTQAELRLLPLLTTHMTFSEIAAHLSISRSTVKTQASSIYRRLGVSRRTEAVNRAIELDLLRPSFVISACGGGTIGAFQRFPSPVSR